MVKTMIIPTGKPLRQKGTTQDRQVYTVHEVHRILGIGINQAYELVKNAPFPVVKIRNVIRIPKRSFNDWLAQTQG